MQHIPTIKRVSPACDWDIFVGEDAISIASSSEHAGGSEVEINVLQTGANVAVTQLKSNNCDEGQLVFFFPPLLLCAGDWAEFQSLLFSHSDSVGRREKKKKCPSPTFTQEIHHSVFSMWTKRFQERKTIVSCVSWSSSQNLSHYSQTHCLTFPWDSDALYASEPVWPLCSPYSKYLFIYACTLLMYSHCNLFIHTFCFLSIWSTVLEPGTCMLQQDVGFVLTRLISCRRRHRLIKIIPCYRGCFGQPNDTGGLLCSTDCSRLANGAPRPQLAPN